MFGRGRSSGIHELTPEEGQVLFDRASQRIMGITGDEFIRQWESGALRHADEPAISELVTLMPLGRKNPA